MDKIRHFLWKNMGVTLNRETYFLIGAVLVTCVAAFGLGFLPVITHNQFLRVLFTLATVPGVVIVIGSSYRLVSWTLADKRERENIEREVALGQLKKRVRSKHWTP